MIDQDTLNKIVLLSMKWERFKRLRNRRTEDVMQHADYMTINQREDLLNQVFRLIRK